MRFQHFAFEKAQLEIVLNKETQLRRKVLRRISSVIISLTLVAGLLPSGVGLLSASAAPLSFSKARRQVK